MTACRSCLASPTIHLRTAGRCAATGIWSTQYAVMTQASPSCMWQPTCHDAVSGSFTLQRVGPGPRGGVAAD